MKEKKKRIKEWRLLKMKQKERKKLNKRNYFNCVSNYDNCTFNLSRSINSNAYRKKWNTNTSTKC